MAAPRIAVIGFGFSGLMVTANLVRELAEGSTLYIVANQLTPVGVAYSTTNPHHLLNVPAGRMGAYPEAIDDFMRWLQTPDAALCQQRLGLAKAYTASDFVPRALYAGYLENIWRDTQQRASERQIFLKLVETTATAITPGEPLALLTTRGDAIAIDRIVLATGNEVSPILPQLPAASVIQNPWAKDVLKDTSTWPAPIALMGVGLTAVDTVLALRDAGYHGEIVAFSRHGLLPQDHEPATALFSFEKETLANATTLSALLRLVRRAITQQNDWRRVIDALRPHTSWLWQRLPTPQQQRFMRRLGTIWNVHRHRMAPEIAATIASEIAQGSLRVIASARYEAKLEESRVQLLLSIPQGEVSLSPSRIINCTGPEMRLARSAKPLFKQLLANGMIEPHATSIGLAADPQQRAWGMAYPHLYAMGSLLTGQLWESTAVPELRTQAQEIARTIRSTF